MLGGGCLMGVVWGGHNNVHNQRVTEKQKDTNWALQTETHSRSRFQLFRDTCVAGNPKSLMGLCIYEWYKQSLADAQGHSLCLQ
jgi:hypothetical protein